MLRAGEKVDLVFADITIPMGSMVSNSPKS